MPKKLSLDLDALSVESFDTTVAEGGGRGTVRGHGLIDPEPTPPVYADECTCNDSCLRPSNAYYCATVRYTAISCKYTYNLSCIYQ